MRPLTWSDIVTGGTDALEGSRIELTGWMMPAEEADEHSHFLLAPEPVCMRRMPAE